MGIKALSLSGILLLISLVVTAAVVQRVYKAYTSPLRDIPGPWLARLTRLWLAKAIAGADFEKTNIQLHQKYGPIVRIAPNEYSIDDFDAAQIIYRHRDQLRKSRRYYAWGLPHGEPNTFISEDIEHHAYRRKQINAAYSLGSLFNVEYQVDGVLQDALSKMDNFVKSGESVDMAKWFNYYAFDTIGALTFGKPFGFLDKCGDIRDVMATIHLYSAYGAVMGIYHEWHKTVFTLLSMTAPKGEIGIAYVQKFASDAIKDASKDTQKLNTVSIVKNEDNEISTLKYDYVTTLLARSRKDPQNFKEDDVLYHVIGNVVAGAETTAITLSAIFYYLSRSISVLDKLRGELDAFMQKRESKGPIQMKEALELPYLQAVVKEGLRLFPATGLPMPRLVPTGGLDLAGHHFPEGTVVGVNSWVANHNKSVFGMDADEFRPERWLRSPAEVNRMELYFFTFGRGPRMCAGKQISLMELSKLIPELVLKYDITLADPRHDWTVSNGWFVQQSDYMCKITERK
ncbi:hypothetical protein MMC15_008260 [Xylographa vitiligo]|nr:hypothetical protein [Xylographa vitiligo]